MTSGKYEEAESRWAGVGPYYAMFPSDFATRVIKKYTSAGATILDPFAGRGTAIFSAATNGRCGIGIELNPVGWVYSQTKLRPASKTDVLARLTEMGRFAVRRKAKPDLPLFFTRCFSESVLRFLLTVRDRLNWRRNRTDRTLMALVLINMHGKRDASLSNQMRQTKSMSPDYAIDWWGQRMLDPPEIDPIAFMRKRIDWRYSKGVPVSENSFVYLGDSTVCLTRAKRRSDELRLPKVKLLLTSPPYCGVTNYHYDQWLRLWLLGGEPSTQAVGGRNKGRFTDRKKYEELLSSVFKKSKPFLARDATIYVRTDYRPLTLDITVSVLKKTFPNKRMFRRAKPIETLTQTHLFGNQVKKSAEVDLVMLPKKGS